VPCPGIRSKDADLLRLVAELCSVIWHDNVGWTKADMFSLSPKILVGWPSPTSSNDGKQNLINENWSSVYSTTATRHTTKANTLILTLDSEHVCIHYNSSFIKKQSLSMSHTYPVERQVIIHSFNFIHNNKIFSQYKNVNITWQTTQTEYIILRRVHIYWNW